MIDVKALAQQAGAIPISGKPKELALAGNKEIEAFAAMILEAAAVECDKKATRNFPWASENSDIYHAQAHWADQCATAIRAMKLKGDV